MDSSDRRNEILDYLEKNHIVYSSELCQSLNVSPMTIHRDFQAMAKQGLITIIRGGAVLNHGTSVLYSLNLHQTSMPLEKQRIAKYCAELVREGSTIFIDCGSTAELIAESIRHKKNITIMTNSLDTAHVLSSSKENKLIMVPGVFAELLRGFSGQMTTDFMSRFQVDMLFLGANGIDVAHGLTSPDYTDAETKRVLIKHARQIIVASDHTKLGKNFFVTIAKLPEINLIVTDKEADPNIIEDIKACGTNIALV